MADKAKIKNLIDAIRTEKRELTMVTSHLSSVKIAKLDDGEESLKLALSHLQQARSWVEAAVNASDKKKEL